MGTCSSVLQRANIASRLLFMSSISHVFWACILGSLSVLTHAQQQSLRVATFSTELAPGPDLEKSLKHVRDTLTGSNIDVVCMQGVYVDLGNISLGLPDFSHIYQLPKLESSIPCKCTSLELTLLLTEAMSCMSNQCKDQGGGMMAYCLMGEECLGKLKGDIGTKCIACVGSALSDPSIMSNPANLMNACMRKASDPEPSETQACEGPYGGSYGVAVASKFPFSSTKAIHFPNTIVCNRGFAHVSVEVSCGTSVDVLCGWWRSNATILPPQFGFDYFPPQEQSDPKAFYGTDTLPTSPVEEAALQSKYTADYATSKVESSRVAIIAGNFGVGPNIPDAEIGSESSKTYQLHADNFAASGFSNPMVSSSAPVCSDCVHDGMTDRMEKSPTAKRDMASSWGMSEEEFTSRVAEMQNMLIDHVWIRGVEDGSKVTPFRTPIPDGFRYPMGISFNISTVSSCPDTNPAEIDHADEPFTKFLWISVCTLLYVQAQVW